MDTSKILHDLENHLVKIRSIVKLAQENSAGEIDLIKAGDESVDEIKKLWESLKESDLFT